MDNISSSSDNSNSVDFSLLGKFHLYEKNLLNPWLFSFLVCMAYVKTYSF